MRSSMFLDYVHEEDNVCFNPELPPVFDDDVNEVFLPSNVAHGEVHSFTALSSTDAYMVMRSIPMPLVTEAKLTERALELLALPDDGVHRLLLDFGCGSGLSGETLSENGHQWIGLDISQAMLDVAVEWEVEGDQFLVDMGQGLGFRPGVIDGGISISAVQIDKSCHEPRLRLKSLSRGARAVFQIYPQNDAQRELVLSFAMRAEFAGVVVDYPHSTKSRKEYLALTCGPPSLSTAAQKARGEDGGSSSDDESSGDEENRTVSSTTMPAGV